MADASDGGGNSMQFKEFTDWSTERPKCSLRRDGTLGFSREAVRRLGLKEGYVRVYFEEQLRIVGIKQIGPTKEDGAVPLVMKPNNVFIPATALFDRYRIDYSEGKSYEPEWSDEHRMILVNLNNPLKRGKTKRDGKAPSERTQSEEESSIT